MEEIAAGADLYDLDTDGDGYNDKDEITNGSGVTNNASRPFDPHFPPASADLYVDGKAYNTITSVVLSNFQNGTVELPFATIGQAISASADGDVIEVAPDSYPETVSLAGKDVKLYARDGRDSTSINGLNFAVANTVTAMVAGFEIRGAVQFNGGAGVLSSCLVENNGNAARGIDVGSGDAVIINTVVSGFGSSAGSALRITGGGTASVNHCSLIDNTHSGTGGSVSVASGGALDMSDSIVHSPSSGVEIAAASGSDVQISLSNIEGGFTGVGNFDDAPALDADHRLAPASTSIDRDFGSGIDGFRFLSRFDWDTEARQIRYGGSGNLIGDVGADEYVSRLTFPKLDALANPISTSQVDEASGIVSLGTDADGDSLLAIIDDEEDEHLFIYKISATTGDIVDWETIDISTNPAFSSAGDQEIKDLEGITFDGDYTLYLTTSHTKRNRYRGVASTSDDRNVMPPSGDYDRRRNQFLKIELATDFLDVPLSGIASGVQITFAESENTTFPASVGYDPRDGLGRYLRTSLELLNSEFQSSDIGDTVLIARSMNPIFGSPVDATSYAVGATLPDGGGTVVSVSASGSFTDTGLAANATYFYKAWPVDVSTPSSPLYGAVFLPGDEPISGIAQMTGLPKLFVNEMQTSHSSTISSFAALPDWVEIYNPSDSDVDVGGFEILNSSSDPQLPPTLDAGTVIPGNGFLVLAEGWSPLVISEINYHPRGEALVITEIDYNPPGSKDLNEYVEILNRSNQAVNLNGFVITQDGTVIRSIGNITLQPFARRVETFTKMLDNGGSRIRLRDPSGKSIFNVKYDDDPPWSAEPDGTGKTLVLADPWLFTDDYDDVARWAVSQTAAGSQGSKDGNEAAKPGGFSLDQEFVEILNRGTEPVNLAGYVLTQDEALGETTANVVIHTFGNTTLAPGQRETVFFVETLDDGGEDTKIQDNSSPAKTLFKVSYDDLSPWPVSADAGGASLVLIDPFSIRDEDSASRWSASSGAPTPDAADPSEVASAPTDAVFSTLPFSFDGLGDSFIIRVNQNQLITSYTVADLSDDISDGRAWDGGAAGIVITNGQPLMDGAKFQDAATFSGTSLACTPGSANHVSSFIFFRATADEDASRVHLAWDGLGRMPGIAEESPKHHSQHAANIEGLAYRDAGETMIACRSPLSIDRVTGNAFYYRVSNLTTFLNYQPDVDPPSTVISPPQQIDLRGQGVRSIEWVPQLAGGAGRYLIIGGPANGGPLEKERALGKFSLYAWTGLTGATPQLLIDDLKPYAKRPEGIEIMTINSQDRVVFTEDRFLASGYVARNAIHWPIGILGTVQ